MTDKQFSFCLKFLADKLESAVSEALKDTTGSLEPIETIIQGLRFEIENLKESESNE